MMTKNRRDVYKRSWYSRECKVNIRARRKQYNRKIRYSKIYEDSTSKEAFSLRRSLEWDTVS